MTTTTYLEWEDQATGANNNTWGDVTDANFTIFELAIARFATISTTGGTTTLTSSQNRYPVLRITGVLASNATIVVRTAEKNWHVINATTGNFSVTVKTLSGTGKTVPRGRSVKLYCDGTNVEQVRPVSIPAAQAGGTVDAITATFEPATVSGELQDGTLFLVEAAGANTSTTPTFNPDGLGALTITKNGGQALAVGDIRAAGHKLLLAYDASSTRYELLNPSTSDSPYFTSIELGNASDTTITRSAAGVIAVEGGVVPKENRANTFSADQTFSGNVGIGGTPAASQGKLQVVNTLIAGGAPASSGATDANQLVAFQSGGVQLRFGVYADGSTWLQSSYYNDYAVNTDIVLQPNGGNVLVTGPGGLGYGTGSGGTVTQATSKGTNVTLNKTNGKITMSNSSLSPGTAGFAVTNSTVAATDTIIINISGGAADFSLYNVWAVATAGGFFVYLKNISSGALAEAVELNFSVIKAVTS